MMRLTVSLSLNMRNLLFLVNSRCQHNSISLQRGMSLKSFRHTHAVEHKHPVHKAELTFVTNEDGIVTVPSLHIGQWLAKVQNKKSFQDKSLCDETVDVATLSFSRN